MDAFLNPDQRAELTTSCRDSDVIAKVPEAGTVKTVDGTSVQVMHNGVVVVEGCYYGDWMTQIIAKLQGHHEPQEELVFSHVVETLAADTPNPTVMEVGAFWAYYSLWVLQRIPAARAIMVEPDPNNLEVGKRNFALNGRTGEFLAASIGAEARPPEPFPCESDQQMRMIPMESLPSLLERFEVERLDLLMCDIQGFETQLLEGGRDVIADRVRFLTMSTHHHRDSGDPTTHYRCLEMLRELGAHIICEHTVAESFSGDGLIVASFDERDRGLVVETSRARTSTSLYRDPLYDLADARTTIAQQQVELETAHAEVAAMRASKTWRLHERLRRSRVGRAVLAAARRATRTR